jgi:SAM-dependent methyltransferase
MRSNLIETAAVVGNDWVAGKYYDDAEQAMSQQWAGMIWPIIKDSDFSTTLEVAPGHGRNTAKLLELASHVHAVDINQTNIDVLNQRFSGNDKLTATRNTGADLRMIKGGSVSFVYCFDAMVHFDSDVVRAYIKEFRRVMKPGARGFIHYSAYDKNPTGTYRDHPGWRNFMSRALFEHWLAKEGLRVLKSEYVYIGGSEDADAATYFELPASMEPSGAFYDVYAHVTQLKDEIRAGNASLERRIGELEERLRESETQREALETSSSWRMTAPLRRLVQLFRRQKARSQPETAPPSAVGRSRP